MPDLPGLTYVTVTATFLNSLGAPSVGSVRFAPTTRWVNATTHQVITPKPIVVELDQNGHLSVAVPSTDDADFLPAGRTIRVTEFIDGAPQHQYDIHLPGATPTQDLGSIAPLLPTEPSAVYVLAGADTGGQIGTYPYDPGDDGGGGGGPGGLFPGPTTYPGPALVPGA